VEIVQVILESVLLRREKTMRDRDGNRIVELPAKEVRIARGLCTPANIFQVVVEHLEFSPMERMIYDSMYMDAKKNFDRLNAKGLIGRNYTHILAMLMRCALTSHCLDII
jgi:DNA repair protein RAD5